jgi:hypothetical protein
MLAENDPFGGVGPPFCLSLPLGAGEDRAATMEIRRVIAGVAEGRAAFTHDEAVVAVRSPQLENEIARLWGCDQPPVVPSDDGPQPPSASFFPPPGGMRAVIWTAPPYFGVARRVSDEDAARSADELLPGMASVEVRDDGVHTTATVDFELVLRGEIELVLDGGAARGLQAGDIAVVNGVGHAWRNHSDEACVLLAVFYGAETA